MCLAKCEREDYLIPLCGQHFRSNLLDFLHIHIDKYTGVLVLIFSLGILQLIFHVNHGCLHGIPFYENNIIHLFTNPQTDAHVGFYNH